MRQHAFLFCKQTLIFLIIHSLSLTIVYGDDEYPESIINSDQIDDDVHNQHPFLLPIKDWFKKVSNPMLKCIQHDQLEREYRKGKDSKQTPIFKIVNDCSSNKKARWDYNIRLNNGNPKRGQPFDGYAVVKFSKVKSGGNIQGKMKQGFKLGKCFLLNDNNISEISGTFHADQLKGEVKIEYHDGSFIIGNTVKENIFYGMLRRFTSDQKLQSIINVREHPLASNIEESDLAWKKLPSPFDHNIIFRSSSNNRVFIMTKEFAGEMFDCMNVVSSNWQYYYFERCYKLIQGPLMNDSQCDPIINVDLSFIKRDKSVPPFSYSILTNESYTTEKSLYPSCKNENVFNIKNIRDSVDVWWKEMSNRNKNPFWFHPSSNEPFFDSHRPQVDINLNYFSHRKSVEKKSIQIFNHAKLLYEGIILSGKIYADVNAQNIFDWAGALKIIIRDITSQLSVRDDIQFIIQGKLHRSKLNGIVRIFGTLPNDLEDDCKDNITPRLGFIGHYKEGIPSGYCWKGLLGGSWVYGKVDEKGDFSGGDIAYINQDMSTAFKGTFKNGVMINAKAVEVIGERCNEDGIKIIQFTTTPASNTQNFHFERPTTMTFGDQPHTVDPLDSKYLRLGKSNIDTGEESQSNKENGVFANVNIPEGTIIAHNNGYILNKTELVILKYKQSELVKRKEKMYDEMEVDEGERNETIASYSERFWKYRTNLKCYTSLDIPYEAGQATSRYRATVGHKINHSFSSANARLTIYDSARFGIGSAVATRHGINIPKGAELFIHYGYSYFTGPRWYKQLFRDFLFEMEKKNINLKDAEGGCRIDDNTNCDSLQSNKGDDIMNGLLLKYKISSDKTISDATLDSILSEHNLLASQGDSQQTTVMV